MQLVDSNKKKCPSSVTVTESLDIFPIKSVSHQAVNPRTEMAITIMRRHVRLCIYDPHDIVSLDRERSIPDRNNNITIDDLMMEDPRQKISFIKLQLLCIISWYYDASGSIKRQSGYTYYSRQYHNQAKYLITEECSCFTRLIPGLVRRFT